MGFLDRIFGRAAPAPRAPEPPPPVLDGPLDEREALLVERWLPEQQREYAGYGRTVLAAAVDLDEGNVGPARAALEALLASAAAPRFLLRDVGRARLAAGDAAGAEGVLRRFLATPGEPLAPDVRLETHLDLVRIAQGRADVESAIEELAAAVEALPEDPRPSFLLGQYLRMHGYAEEALTALESAATLQGTPSAQVLEEMGLACLELGRTREAEGALTEVVRRAKCSCGAKVPETTAVALASIYEATGRGKQAAELLAGVGRASCGSH